MCVWWWYEVVDVKTKSFQIETFLSLFFFLIYVASRYCVRVRARARTDKTLSSDKNHINSGTEAVYKHTEKDSERKAEEEICNKKRKTGISLPSLFCILGLPSAKRWAKISRWKYFITSSERKNNVLFCEYQKRKKQKRQTESTYFCKVVRKQRRELGPISPQHVKSLTTLDMRTLAGIIFSSAPHLHFFRTHSFLFPLSFCLSLLRERV